MYRQLNPDSIIDTAKLLQKRVSERFSDRNISQVGSELVQVSEKAKREALNLDRPDWGLRLLVALIVAAGAVAFLYLGTLLNFSKVSTDTFGIVQGLEASINTLILAGLGLAFLFNAERRQKRQRALKALHELRSLAHVIDMHQLTKDPNVVFEGGPRTESSPERTMDEFMLTRYLDYCSEMLAICGKTAAIYAQYYNDPVIHSAVNEIESLTTNLSRKIWQKITLMHSGSGARGSTSDQIKAALHSVAGR